MKFPDVRDKAQSIITLFQITNPPIDVEAIAEKLDFIVIPYDLGAETSAVLFIHEGTKAIGVNKNHAPVRRRFSVAHELGHFLSGHEDYPEKGEGEKLRVEGQSEMANQHEDVEREANAFAAELLMPEGMLKAAIAREGRLDASALAKIFDVSEQALWIQLVNLEIAPQT